MYNKAVLLEFNGTNYQGWQKQKSQLSIQNLLETAISQIYQENIKSIGAGRTDAGVHALSQVMSFKSEKHIDSYKLKRGINAFLPDDIVVLDIKDVEPEFSALYGVKSKSYVYKIINREAPLTIDKNLALWIRRKIDIDLLKLSLNKFIGEKDFTSFCMSRSKKESCVRKINFINTYIVDDKILIEINANGFLHNMIRIMIGTILDINFNSKNPDMLDQIIESKDRKLAAKTESASGLYQLKVFYNHELFDVDEKKLIRML